MKISIIIPVFNEEFTVLKVLKKIEEVKKSISEDFEIIVINDGSTDNTVKMLRENEEVKVLLKSIQSSSDLVAEQQSVILFLRIWYK